MWLLRLFDAEELLRFLECELLRINTEVDSSDKNYNANSLSSTLERGMDNQGLTMEEKWSDKVIVCKRQKVSGSRVTRKVCHSRADWRAMRENGREVTREVQRRDRGPGSR